MRSGAAASVLRRVAEAAGTLLGVCALTFLLLRVLPGDQVTAAYGIEAGALDAGRVAELRAYYGIDQPLPVQFASWLGGVLTGNLGFSTTAGVPVSELTAAALPVTLELAVLSLLVALVVGVPGGLWAASRPRALRDGVAQGASLLALSVPVFLASTVLVGVVSSAFGWNPNGEIYATPAEDLRLNLQQMTMPALVMGLSIASPVLVTTRSAVLQVRSQDHVRTARAKGVPAGRLQVRHVLRGALVPVVTMGGLQFGFLLGGALVVEQIFSLPGVGRQVLLGLDQQEFSVVQSTVLVIAVLFVLVNLLTDLLYRVVDPRVRVR